MKKEACMQLSLSEDFVDPALLRPDEMKMIICYLVLDTWFSFNIEEVLTTESVDNPHILRVIQIF